MSIGPEDGMMITRRKWLSVTLGGAAAALVTHTGRALALPAVKPVRMTVYKTPTCGCCRLWVSHARGVLTAYDIETLDMDDLTEVKTRLGVPPALQSCHTAISGPYVFEGHVPADLIKRFLAQRPKALGLAVPGMPMGSPGMDMGGRKEPYDVLLFDKAGKTRVYAKR
ncbi:MAG: DUF411 domain-containing protein [Gemmatimonadaceae bacterium]